MRYLKTYKLFESRGWKVIPEQVYNDALRQLRKEDSIDNVDELFSFIDYWMTVSDLADYNPEQVKKRSDSYYSSPPSSDEEWFPMWTSDEDTIEYIMRALSRVYADSSFEVNRQLCHKCGGEFTQRSRHDSFCSMRCKEEYDKDMSNYR